MTNEEHAQWQSNKRWLKPEQAEQWTVPVREAWLKMRRAHSAWQATHTAPTDMMGSIKDSGSRAPLWIPNDEWNKYQEAAQAYRKVQPAYISNDRATYQEEEA
jgi:hypothetical protein